MTIDERHQWQENGRVLKKNQVRPLPAQETPGLQALYQIPDWSLMQAALLPITDDMHRSAQPLCQEIAAPLVIAPGYEYTLHK
jgi:hypothetical protein